MSKTYFHIVEDFLNLQFSIRYIKKKQFTAKYILRRASSGGRTVVVPVFLEEDEILFVCFEAERLQTFSQLVDCDVTFVVVVLAVENSPQH